MPRRRVATAGAGAEAGAGRETELDALSIPAPVVASPLAAAFYDRDPALVARELLGTVLAVEQHGIRVAGRVIETEAYLGPHDPACHATAGRTARTWQLFGPPGIAYVYRIYGLHWCVNAVTREEGFGSAVLIRALAPLEGIEAMRTRRPRARTDADLCNGPGKLCAALDIDRRHDGLPLTGESPITITRGGVYPDPDVLMGPRIGITKAAAWPLRFWLVGADVVRPRAGVPYRTPHGDPDGVIAPA